MRARLNWESEPSCKIILIKYVRNISGCTLKEAKEFVEGTGELPNLTHDMNVELAKMFGYIYEYQSDEWIRNRRC
jgi:ribosomal protein L7/L12